MIIRPGLSLALLLGLGTPCDARPSPPDRTILRLENNGVVEVDLGFEPSTHVLTVGYRLLNTSPTAGLAVFDRADLFMVADGRQRMGEIAVPHQTMTEQGDVTVTHEAWPPSDPRSETPFQPVAMMVAPGAVLNGQFTYGVWVWSHVYVPVRRIRWCLGYMPFDGGALGPPTQTSEGEVRAVLPDAALTQILACTSWYDVASGAFEA